MTKNWAVIEGADAIEVVPNNDLKTHQLSHHCVFCKCDPRVEIRESKRPLIIHNSWDGREMLEEPNEHSC